MKFVQILVSFLILYTVESSPILEQVEPLAPEIQAQNLFEGDIAGVVSILVKIFGYYYKSKRFIQIIR